jgi:hypothetical protein
MVFSFAKHPERLAAIAAGKWIFEADRPCKFNHPPPYLRYVRAVVCVRCMQLKYERTRPPGSVMHRPERLKAAEHFREMKERARYERQEAADRARREMQEATERAAKIEADAIAALFEKTKGLWHAHAARYPKTKIPQRYR